jgi:hypothetical protein
MLTIISMLRTLCAFYLTYEFNYLQLCIADDNGDIYQINDARKLVINIYKNLKMRLSLIKKNFDSHFYNSTWVYQS